MEVKLDPRPFGFPFDRKVGFKLEDNNLKLVLAGVTFKPPLLSPIQVPADDLGEDLLQRKQHSTS